VTLPAFRQRVHTYTRRGAFPTMIFTFCRFGSKRRRVATIEWLRLFPKEGPFPQLWQILAIGGCSVEDGLREGGLRLQHASYDRGTMTIVMSTRTVSASQFKAKCLGMLDEVATTGEEIVITKRGRPVARVLAADEPLSLRGSVSFNVSDEELIKPLDVEWDAVHR
jgi:prevent-host-death family protein